MGPRPFIHTLSVIYIYIMYTRSYIYMHLSIYMVVLMHTIYEYYRYLYICVLIYMSIVVASIYILYQWHSTSKVCVMPAGHYPYYIYIIMRSIYISSSLYIWLSPLYIYSGGNNHTLYMVAFSSTERSFLLIDNVMAAGLYIYC